VKAFDGASLFLLDKIFTLKKDIDLSEVNIKKSSPELDLLLRKHKHLDVYRNERTMILSAVLDGNHALVQELISEGADIERGDDYASTPLISATYKGHVEMVKLLLEKGAKINGTGRNGWCAIMEAAATNDVELFWILLKAGADLRFRDDDGWTVLMWACDKGSKEIVGILLRLNVQLDQLSEGGDTALDLAERGGHPFVIKMLEEAGAKRGRDVER
jgi:ankyrin repeat protein